MHFSILKNRMITPIVVLTLAVVISLYFWLGYWAFVIVGVVVVACALFYFLRRIGVKRVDNCPTAPRVEQTHPFVERTDKIIERRREQGHRLVAVAEQLERLRPEHKRAVERLLDWYMEYLKSNVIYHQDLYDYLLTLIKERRKTAKANYLICELERSKIVIRSLIRGKDAAQIVELLDKQDNDDSQG